MKFKKDCYIFERNPFPMKKVLLFFAFVFMTFVSSAQQYVLSTHTIPAQPTDTDDVYLVVDLAFPSGSCDLYNAQVNSVINPDVSLYHCLGMLTVICYETDTVHLGQLPAGNMVTTIHVMTGPLTGPTGCSAFTEVETATAVITVNFANGISGPAAAEPHVYFNASTNQLSVGNASGYHIESLTSTDGKIVFKSSNESQVTLPSLATGIYYYVVKNSAGLEFKGKVAISQVK